MSRNLLVINVDIREIRVALIEQGIIAELHIERLSRRSILGNIYLGTVSRVLPGMQAAFIDVGQDRAAFLHVEDLIRPDDFEAYLHREHQEEEEQEIEPTPAAQAVVAREAIVDEDTGEGAAGEGADENESESAGDGDGDGDGNGESAGEGDSDRVEAAAESVDVAIDEDGSEGEDGIVDEVTAEEDAGGEPMLADAGAGEVVAVGDEANGEVIDEPTADLPLEPMTAEAGAADEAGPAADEGEERQGGGKRRRRRVRVARSAQKAPEPQAPAPAQGRGRNQGRDGRNQGRDGRNQGRDGRNQGGRGGRGDRRRGKDRKGGGKVLAKSRISKSTPIREVVREGQKVIVQVTKEPIGTKGARVSSHVSLPGRYVVYLPTVEHVGISKRIGSDKERSRLREVIDSVRPPKGGLVVRTVAEGLTKKGLKNDVGYLVKLWSEIARKRDDATKAPSLLYEELDLVLRTARDLFTEDVGGIVIDNREQFIRLRRFVEMFMPERAGDIELYEGREPVFDAYGIEDEIGRALSRKVPLGSGGHLIIDQAEALTAIDVNTGRFVGKGSRDLEDTILATNLEAVEEIAYQLRFRNIGGLIILDLIDMEKPSNREKVRRRLEELLSRDKAKTTLNRISDLGLIEMTRKRTRESLGRVLHEPCFYCDGTGQLMSRETVAYEILRQIRREQAFLKGWRITVNAHPTVIDLLKSEERLAVQEAERMFARRIELVAKPDYHLEQYDLQGA
jgi:ribonuclease G